ncbi:obscurin-like protein 1 [Saccoglossus kowalevskii]
MDVEHNDAKNYQCSVAHGGGDSAIISGQASLTVTDPQRFHTIPSDITVLAGNSAVLECVVSDKEGIVIWTKNGEDISSDATITNGDNRFSITGNQDNGEYNLQIVNADIQDTGIYECRVTASGQSAKIGPDTASLAVQALQSFDVQPASTVILERNDVTLFCSVSDKAGQLVWSLNGEDISSDSTITTSISGYTITSPTQLVDYNLKIESVRAEHAGNYVCSVTSANGHPEITSDTALLTVEIRDPQSFLTTPNDTTILAGNSVVMECAVKDKEGIVIWTKSGVDISSDATITNGDNRFSITGNQDNGEYNLQIVNADSGVYGLYTCRVTASGRSEQIASSYAILRVQELQSFVVEPVSTNCLESSNVTLFCSVSNIAGQLVWSLNGEDISSNSTNTTTTSGYIINSPTPSVDYNLMIESVRPEHAGNYVCSVTSANGHPEITSDTAVLTVEHLQDFITEPLSIMEHKGDDVTLFCSVSNKAGQLVWSLNGEDISSDSTITTSISGYTINSPTPSVDYNLKIQSVRAEHAGNYVCSVTSANGHPEITSDTAILTVEPPLPTCAPSTVSTLIIGENLILVCETERDEPAAILRWIQDGGEEQDGITLDTDTEIRVGLVLTITEELQGSVFTCESIYPTHHTNLTCQVGPLAVDILQTEIRLFSKKDNIYAKVGEDITMDCTVQNKLGTIHWIKDGQVISNDTIINNDENYVTRYFIGGDQSIGEFNLNINSVSKPDTGSYYCLLTSSVEELPVVSSNVMQLNIGDAIPPEDNYPQCAISSKNIIDGDIVLLTCMSKGGDPPATLQWDQDGNNQKGIQIDESTLSLHVDMSNEINGATFTCTSKHSTFNQSQTCVIGPLEVRSRAMKLEGTPKGDSWSVGFAVVLVFLIITILILIILTVLLVRKKHRTKTLNVTI